MKKQRPIRKPMTVGERYGRLVVSNGPYYGADGYEYDFKCDCGNECRRSMRYARYSPSPSCGCAARDAHSSNGKKNATHGLTRRELGNENRRKLYDVYRQMLRRCHNPNSSDYPCWGGRGISVCEEWRDDVMKFISWAEANGYVPGVTIERVDNNKGYCPENCSWIPNERQAQNTRRVRMITAFGRAQTIREWSSETGIPYRTILSRLGRGWDADAVMKK